MRRPFPPSEQQLWQVKIRETVEHNKHGDRTETRRLSATNRCNHQLNWPGLQQVCRMERTIRRGDKPSQEVAYAITSLSLSCATPQRLLRLWRGHWAIENSSHYVRDVVLGEDACRVRSGNAPQTLAALRNAVIGLLRSQKTGNLAAAIRNLAWDFRKAAQLVGVGEVP